MLIVRPDFARRIDLPGAGPCPRPIDIDRAVTGFAELVSLRVYTFAKDAVIDGEAEEDEVFIVLMRGRADIAVTQHDERVGLFALDANGGTRAVFLPPHGSYHLTAVDDCDIAYARVAPLDAPCPPVQAFAPVGDRLTVIGHATGMDLVLATLPAGGEVAPAVGARLFERFVHIRTVPGTSARVAGASLDDWDAVILSEGESVAVKAESGVADILTVSASRARSRGIEPVGEA